MRRHWIWVTLALTVVVPAAATAASTRISPPTPAIAQPQSDGTNLLTPIDDGIAVHATRVGKRVSLRWSSGGPWRANVFYRVYRSDRPKSDLVCATGNKVSWTCYLYGQPIATTRTTTYVDPDAPPDAIYRIGVGTNWANDPNLGDVFAFSDPAASSR